MQFIISVLVSVLSLLALLPAAHAESSPATRWVAPGHGGIVEAIASNASGSIIASTDDGTIKIWTSDGVLLHTIYARARALAIAPNGDTLAVGSGDGISLYSITSGARLAFVASQIGECSSSVPTDEVLRFGVNSLAFSPNGLFLVTAGGCAEFYTSPRGKGEVKLWQVSDLSFIRNLPETNWAARSVAYTYSTSGVEGDEHGRVAIGGVDPRVLIVDPVDGTTKDSITVGTSDVASVAFSADHKLLAVGGSHTDMWTGVKTVSLELFQQGDYGTYSLLRTLTGHTDRVTSVAFFYGNMLVSASYDRTIRFWGSSGSPTYETITVPAPFAADVAGGVQCLATAQTFFMSGGAIGDGSLRKWIYGTPAQVQKFNYHQSSVLDLAYRRRVSASNDSLMLYSVGADNQLYRFDANSEQLSYLTPTSFPNTEYFSDFTPDANHAAVRVAYAASNNLGVRHLDTGSTLYMEGATNGAAHAKFSPDGRILVAADQDGYLLAWTPFVPTNYQLSIWKQKAHDRDVRTLNITPDGQRVITTGYRDHLVKIWKLADGTLEREISDFATGGDFWSSADFYSSVAVSPDGTMIAVYGNTRDSSWNFQINVYRLRDGARLKTLTQRGSPMIFTPDNTKLGVTAGGGWIFHSLADDSTSGYFYGPGMISVNLAPDGRSVVTSWEDNTVSFYRSSDAEKLFEYDANAGSVAYFSYTPDSSLIALGGSDGTVRMISNPVAVDRRLVSVTSFNPENGVSISAPKDRDNLQNGTTPFTRSYLTNDALIFTAPETSGGKTFQYWLKDGAYIEYNKSVSVQPRDKNYLITAVYGTGLAPTPTPAPTAPKITKVKATSSGGYQLLLTGKNFKKGLKVYINGKRWTNFKIQKSSKLALNGGRKLRSLVRKKKPGAIKLVGKSGVYTVYPYRWK